MRALYRSPTRPGLVERKLIRELEELVLGQIASSLDRPRGELERDLHARHPAFSSSAAPTPFAPSLVRPDPIAPVVWAEHDFLGTFRVDAALAIGEHPSSDETITGAERPCFLGLAASGEWYAFVRGDEEVEALVAVHAAHAPAFESLDRSAHRACDLVVTDHRVAVLDAAVVHDVRFTDELDLPLFDEGLVLDRGCHCHVASPGKWPLEVVEDDARLVFVRIPLVAA